MPGASINLAPNGDSENQNRSFSLRFDVDRYRYGYALHDKTTRAAIACLLFYALFICAPMLFVFLVVCRGCYKGGSLWGDISSIVALAVNSAPEEHLYGTSAGVKDQKTWELLVRVREAGSERLEMTLRGQPRKSGTMEP
jgi:hypothetical protein